MGVEDGREADITAQSLTNENTPNCHEKKYRQQNRSTAIGYKLTTGWE